MAHGNRDRSLIAFIYANNNHKHRSEWREKEDGKQQELFWLFLEVLVLTVPQIQPVSAVTPAPTHTEAAQLYFAVQICLHRQLHLEGF